MVAVVQELIKVGGNRGGCFAQVVDIAVLIVSAVAVAAVKNDGKEIIPGKVFDWLGVAMAFRDNALRVDGDILLSGGRGDGGHCSASAGAGGCGSGSGCGSRSSSFSSAVLGSSATSRSMGQFFFFFLLGSRWVVMVVPNMVIVVDVLLMPLDGVC